MLELNKFTLKCLIVIFVFIHFENSYRQKVVYQYINVHKRTHYSTGVDLGVNGRTEGSKASYWYFQEGHWPEVMVDGDGKNLRARMKGCDECVNYLDKMAIYSKKSRNNSILGFGGLVGAVVVGIIGLNVINNNNARPYNKKEKVGNGIVVSSGVVLGFSIYGFIKSSKIANKRWPDALQKSVTAYNAYITRLNNGEE